MRTRVGHTLTGAVVAATLITGLTGCGSNDTPTAKPTHAPSTVASATPSPTSPTHATSDSPIVTPGSSMPGSDGTIEGAFGTEYTGENGQVVTDQMAALVGSVFTNPDVASGKQTLTNAVGSLPLVGEAATYAKAHPATLGMPKIVTGSRTPVAPYAEQLHREAMNVPSVVAKYKGNKVVKATFTAIGRLSYSEAGTPMTLDYQRVYEVYLSPSTDTKGDRWDIVAYHGSDVTYNQPQVAKG